MEHKQAKAQGAQTEILTRHKEQMLDREQTLTTQKDRTG